MSQLPSLGIAAITIFAFWLIGKKRRSGWAVGFLSEIPWTIYAIWLHQYGLLIACFAFFGIYAWNWRAWKGS